jgi:hypothetical protein
MNSRVDVRLRRRFYVWAALACGLIAVGGFAQTYYLKSLFETPALPASLHLHGIIMSAWCLLFAAQALLVAMHRVRVHRRLGMVGAVLAVLVVAAGAHATVEATAREVHDHVVHKFHFLFGLNLVNLAVFASLVAAALVLRTSPGFHKRLMLLATLTMLAPAIARLVLLFTHDPMTQIWAFDACILTCIAVDTGLHRTVHPAFAWGGLFVLGSFHLIFLAISATWWVPFVERVFT